MGASGPDGPASSRYRRGAVTPIASPDDSGLGRALAWARGHLRIVGAAGGAVVVLILIVVIIAATSSSKSGQTIPPGGIVQSGPLTSGYRLTGLLKKHSADTLTVQIQRVDASAGEARNVVLRPGAEVEFDRPAQGGIAVARNGKVVASPAGLKDGDTVTLVGQFAPVVVPPGPAHDGYAFFGVEATSK